MTFFSKKLKKYFVDCLENSLRISIIFLFLSQCRVPLKKIPTLSSQENQEKILSK